MAFTERTRKYLVIFLIIGWAITLFFSAKPPEKLYRNSQILMGTFWDVLSCDKEASRIVFGQAQRIEQLLSKYQAKSEIFRLNQQGKLKVSPDTFYIIKKSKELSQATEGAFDITVAPLVDLWGFTNQKFRLPSNKEIRAALKLIGSDKIILHENNNMVEFKIPGVKIDLGAIAKGFALDCAVRELKKNGINSCLINAGGQVYALGDRFGKPWRIAIKNPRNEGVTSALELKNQSASTSGDYEQFFLKDKKRYSHIINPKTGYPAASGITSVTVIANSGLVADALSTSIFVLGKEKAEKLLNKFQSVKAEIY